MTAPPPRLEARALLLAERLDHRGLARAEALAADPVSLEAPPGVQAFAFRWGPWCCSVRTPPRKRR